MTSAPKQRSNLTIRVISGIIALIVVPLIAYIGWWPLTILFIGVAVIGVLEFCALGHDGQLQPYSVIAAVAVIVLMVATQRKNPSLAVLAIANGVGAVFIVELFDNKLRVAFNHALKALAGIFYVALPLGYLVVMRARPDDGLPWLMGLFAATWGTDFSAYIGGHLWGKTPLAPKISPKKTREGAAAGLVGGTVWALSIFAAYHMLSLPTIVYALIMPVVSEVGDLLESMLKRHFNTKDSRLRNLNPIPGHGGVLDRIDSMLLVSAASFVFLALFAR